MEWSVVAQALETNHWTETMPCSQQRKVVEGEGSKYHSQNKWGNRLRDQRETDDCLNIYG